MKRTDKAAVSARAEQLLNDDVLSGAFEALERDILAKIKGANLNGTDDAAAFMLELGRKLQAVEGVKASLRSHINSTAISEFNEAQKRLRSQG